MDAVRLLGSLMGNNATGGNLMGSLLGAAMGGGGGGGAGGLGALASMLGGGGGGGAAGGLGALAGMLGGGGQQAQQQQAQQQAGNGGGIGGLLASMAQGQAPQANAQQQDEAMVLVKAMCNAAKADGQIDQAEVQNIMGRLGDVDQGEAEWLKGELQSPLDVQGFVQSVPGEMAQQAYAFSLMGMKLDSKQEAQYLGAVAQGLGLNPQTCNQIHAKLGAPEIFK